MDNKTPEQILDEALASMDELPGIDPAAAPATAEIEGLDDDSTFPGDEGDDNLEGLEGEPGEGDELDVTVDEPGEGEGELGDDEDDIDTEAIEGEVDPSAPIVAFVSIERELEAIAAKQGLDRLPAGVTASSEDLVDYMLATGALIELKIPQIGAQARAAREQAFASIEDAEFLATADELGEIGEDLSGEGEDAALLPEGEGELGDGLDDTDPAEAALALEGDLNLDEEKPVPAEKPEEKPVPAADAPAAAGESCTASTDVRFHPVADQEMIATASAADVQLVLAHTGSNPRYNVIIAGVPAAVITWENVRAASGANAEALAGFCSPTYVHNTLEVMASQGVGRVLTDLGAEFYANAYTHSDLATQIQASVHEELGADYQTRVVAMRESLLDLGNLAIAGYSKGYFKGQNPLHAHAVQVLAAAGVVNAEAVALEISSVLPQTFDVAMAKAVEFMDRSPDFVQQTREAIEEVSPRLRAEASAPAMTLGQRLGSQALASAAPALPAAPAVTAAAGSLTSVDAMKARFASKIGPLGRHR